MAEQTDEIPLIDTELTVMALHNDADVETFAEQWNVSMSPNFLAVKDSKKHSIVSHSRRFRNKINLNHQPHELEALRKWIICIVDFGMNIGSEINGIRPALVYKSSKYKH